MPPKDEIAQYVEYLKSQGHSAQDAEDYGAYLRSQNTQNTPISSARATKNDESLSGTAKKYALNTLDFLGGVTRPPMDLALAAGNLPATAVDLYRNPEKRNLRQGLIDPILNIGKAVAYGPATAANVLLSNKDRAMTGFDPEKMRPVSGTDILEKVGTPEEIPLPARFGGFKLKRPVAGAVLDMAASYGANKMLQSGAKAFSEKLAESAMGGGKNLPAGTGRYALDEGIVGLGDTPSDINTKAKSAMSASGRGGVEAAAEIDAAGAPQITKDQLVSHLNDRADEMAQMADIDLAKELRKKATEIAESTDIPDSMSLSYAKELASKQGRGGKYILGQYTPSAKAQTREVIADTIMGNAELAPDSQEKIDAIQKLIDENKKFRFEKSIFDKSLKKVNQLKDKNPITLYDLAVGTGEYLRNKEDNPATAAIKGIGAGILFHHVRPRAAASSASLLNLYSKVPTPQISPLLQLYNESKR